MEKGGDSGNSTTGENQPEVRFVGDTSCWLICKIVLIISREGYHVFSLGSALKLEAYDLVFLPHVTIIAPMKTI